MSTIDSARATRRGLYRPPWRLRPAAHDHRAGVQEWRDRDRDEPGGRRVAGGCGAPWIGMGRSHRERWQSRVGIPAGVPRRRSTKRPRDRNTAHPVTINPAPRTIPARKVSTNVATAAEAETSAVSANPVMLATMAHDANDRRCRVSQSAATRAGPVTGCWRGGAAWIRRRVISSAWSGASSPAWSPLFSPAVLPSHFGSSGREVQLRHRCTPLTTFGPSMARVCDQQRREPGVNPGLSRNCHRGANLQQPRPLRAGRRGRVDPGARRPACPGLTGGTRWTS